MCFSSPSYPAPPTAAEQADADIRRANEQARLDELARQAQLQTQREEEARQAAMRAANIDAAYNAALGYSQNRVNELGLNWDTYSPQVQAELNRIRTTIPTDVSDVSGYFTDNVTDTVLDRAQTQQRNQYINDVNQYASNGFENNIWSNNADDAIIDSILAEQYAPAAESLLRAKQRGTLTDAGYTTAINNLNTQRTAASSQLQGQGQGVLSGYRTDLADIGNEARTAAGSYTLGSTFDPSSYQSRITSLQSDQQARLEGDIRGLLGDTPLFDVTSILRGAGAAQGVTGGTSPLLDSFYADQKRKRADETRGLSGQGVF